MYARLSLLIAFCICFLQSQVLANSADIVRLAAEHTNAMMHWQEGVIERSDVLQANDRDGWRFHEHFWRWGTPAPHVSLGLSADGRGHLILNPVSPGSKMGVNYWQDVKHRFIVAELREYQYPQIHGYLTIGQQHEIKARELKHLATQNYRTFPVNVVTEIPARYAAP